MAQHLRLFHYSWSQVAVLGHQPDRKLRLCRNLITSHESPRLVDTRQQLEVYPSSCCMQYDFICVSAHMEWNSRSHNFSQFRFLGTSQWDKAPVRQWWLVASAWLVASGLHEGCNYHLQFSSGHSRVVWVCDVYSRMWTCLFTGDKNMTRG